MTQGLEAEKGALREAIQRRRRAVSAEAARQAGVAVAGAVVALPGFERVPRVGLYAALPDELPTAPLLEALRARRQPGFFPRCRADGHLEFAPAERFEDLRPGRYGVPEPTSAAEPLGPEDWLVVPGVAFDSQGRRLGRGQGWYDRSFPTGAPSPRRIGVGFACQCVARVPSAPHDRPVDVLVTEAGTYVFDGRGEGGAS